MADDIDDNFDHIAKYENPPGYGDTIGGVVLYDPLPSTIEAACAAFWADWPRIAANAPAMADEHRSRMRAAIEAAVRASA
ncbi:hypothetical protein DA075_09925 [Methylobacterium currus]|uniref:Uncharacterized protein n=1 Tax=Methylobacterium currus TaxID=2051553 RepID=A0A2R4WI28_9HYPH|nr:hypothetical protein [Methylobacterium currus]AWB21190.1 hypothetical protein DA075_09925 [Methylobacterium currus]